jgi:hypothetical protein
MRRCEPSCEVSKYLWCLYNVDASNIASEFVYVAANLGKIVYVAVSIYAARNC